MKTFGRVSLSLLFLFLFACATSASAECAWVLWEGSSKKPVLPLAGADQLSFTRLAAFPTFSACSVSAKTRAERTARFWTARSEGKNPKEQWKAEGSEGVWEVDFFITASSGEELRKGAVSKSYRCFPETVDLRTSWRPW